MIAFLLSARTITFVQAQSVTSKAVAVIANIEGTWQGTLHGDRDRRAVVKITKMPDGTLRSVIFMIDQGDQPITIKKTTFQSGALWLEVDAIDSTFRGRISEDGSSFIGDWKQGDQTTPLILLKTTPDTAWSIPKPRASQASMDPNADPNFEVATVKLSDPNVQGKWLSGNGGKLRTQNTTLSDLMMFAYNVHSKQIVGAPSWAESDRFDVAATPDLPGTPSEAQLRGIMRKLLESRFALKYHTDKKEMSAYVLTVAKGGPKMVESSADNKTISSFNFTKLGHLTFRNITMDGFAHWMQAGVFDRPVVDRTHLQGRFDGLLKWTPDETQFTAFGVKIIPDDSPDAPPPIYTAIQEQIGLKLDAARATVDVMVIDHVEKPSDN
ncbi:TIGR03435 family protein [Terriglobus sp. RCC_193]|uniref:TIGR03435 family protein n=1 Tax=Terriglobus sp. RCC_193 TaxID=3239218 RepID=UPI0035260821